MPNRIHQAMVEEYGSRFGDAPDLVAVDYQGLSVEETVHLRNLAREKDIQIVVVKNSIAARVLKQSLEEGDLEAVLTGQTALIFGGEGLPHLARFVHDFSNKSGKLAVRGGVFEKKTIQPEDVSRFKDIPDRETLLAQVLAALIAPLTGLLGSVNALLTAPAALTEALARKKEGAT